MDNEEQSRLSELQESLRKAQLALQNSLVVSAGDRIVRGRLLRQVDLLSHLVLMRTTV